MAALLILHKSKVAKLGNVSNLHKFVAEIKNYPKSLPYGHFVL